ncbi:MAG: S8 family serine peptidase [Candidatus Obscuribacterales bacterium]
MRLKKLTGLRQMALGLSILIAAATPALAQSKGHVVGGSLPASAYAPNEILVMAHKGADKDECSQALHDADGTIVKTMSNGRMTAYLIRVPDGKMQDTMKKLSKNKEHFDAVQVNMRAKSNSNDPLFSQQYQLPQMNVPAAWNLKGDGRGVAIGVIDTGVNGAQADLAGRVDRGINIITNGPGNVDLGSGSFYHGTFVSTCAAASTNNFTLGAAPAYRSVIVPVDVFNGQSYTYDSDVLNALFYLESRNVRLVNLSVNADVPYTFANSSAHPVLFAAFVDFHNAGGLLFNSAGNDGQFDCSPRTPNLIVISAINANQKLTNFSTYGFPLWFTAAGKNVVSSDVNSQPLTADGTSFSCPLACSVAAQVWGRRPFLTNDQVLQIMVNTAIQPPNYNINKFGYGIPNSGAALVGN